MNHFHSRPVSSNQNGLHSNLYAVVKKHLEHPYQAPVSDFNRCAFAQLLEKLNETSWRGLILDSCCGTGLSTQTLAAQNPDHLVVGIDQSEHRLSKADRESIPDNCILLRANCEAIWQQATQQGIKFEKHYILYPNPWPKKKHLLRRWHGHPAFVFLPQLSDSLELRSNWQLYLQEFSEAWRLATGNTFAVQKFLPENYLTLFEKKYHLSGQPLFRLSISASPAKD